MTKLTFCTALSIAALATAWGSTVLAETTILVTNANDSGDGSLRAALESAAASDTARQIVIVTKDDIAIASTLTYAGQAAIAIHGQGQTVSLAGNATLLAATAGANLTIRNLNFAGPGGFDIQNRGDLNGASAGKGIFVDVRDDQTGLVVLSLDTVTVSGVAGHGVHVSDCTLADACGGGGGGAGEGSPASIAVDFDNVTIDNVGNGSFDADGLRVDERGAGDILFAATDSLFTRVGADGIELDEGQAGGVYVTETGSRFVNNGGYCDPAILSAFLPAEAEGEFEQGARAEADIPGPVTGSPDDACIEREVALYDDGSVEEYEFGLDLDDGFDIDEAGPGGLDVVMINSEISNNLDEGVDFDEEGPGGITASFIGTTASGNTDDGYKLSEEDAGGIQGLMQGAASRDNGGKGAVFEEEDAGGVVVRVADSMTSGNDDSDDTGLEVVQEDAGQGTLTVINSDIADGIDAEGVTVTR
ncbi:hypothetical protein PGB28_02655 [Primorskyibacter aestuariivivens]|uniref:hypothetical protein n=1 Tax=Primorskyibacter aestuariivivens TaxID=1888912 RepID=UPI002301F006|nr:hypothetical protein [Primorskyibacter aestuariivivens]MDA7427344.1 hypothetical protein [Primorskyibacter aestuariivivens]